MVEEIEYAVTSSGQPEVSSQVIGQMVLEKLKNLDQVAYIRYATVYLELDDLEDVRSEIDRLLTS